MIRRSVSGSALVAVLALVAASPACAQHTADNAVASAEDAFGTSVGKETIGVYDEGNVRGFSPSSAGNFRMEGMYFDLQGSPGQRIIGGETIHVGPSTQGFAFPAPTGIVDLQLRKADGSFGVSPLLSTDSFGSIGLEVDAQMPIIGEKLALAWGAGQTRERNAFGGEASNLTLGLIPRWRPSQHVEVLGFWGHQRHMGELAQPLYIPVSDALGDFLPPRIRRPHYPGPDFARTDYVSNAFGLIARVGMGEWTLRTGLFRTHVSQSVGYSNLVFINRDLSTDRQLYAFPASDSGSWSGEVRLSRRFVEGPRQHLLTASLRGRSIDSRYGGGDIADLGAAPLDAVIAPAVPQFAFTALTDDHTRQLTGGLGYTMKWEHRGEVTLGAQRTHYVKSVVDPVLGGTRGVSDVTLPYAAATLRLAKGLALYGSYVRGLEDAGVAPGYATNANEVLPAIRTRQYDLGLTWKPAKGTTVILGVFSITKPYVALDQSGHYGVLGEERHRGVEVSVASAVTKNLRIVTGGVWQQPRVTASPLIAEPVGKLPVNQLALRTRFNVNWTLPFAKAVTVDAYVNHDSDAPANVLNTLRAPGSTRVGGGFRYAFKLAGKSFTARVELYNVFDAYENIPVGSGVYAFNTGRNVTGYLTADF